MKAFQFTIELTQHIAGDLTGRVTCKDTKKVSVFKVPLSKKDNAKYFMYIIKSSMKKVER